MMLAVTDGLAEIRRAIAMGQALPGERLPPARDLAAVLGINRNAVLRALRLLRDEGLPEFRHGHGTTMAATPQRGAMLTQPRELVRLARQHGYRRTKSGLLLLQLCSQHSGVEAHCAIDIANRDVEPNHLMSHRRRRGALRRSCFGPRGHSQRRRWHHRRRGR